LFRQPLFSDGNEPEQLRVVVWRRVYRDDLATMHIDLAEVSHSAASRS
jgi:hypothetical protein